MYDVSIMLKKAALRLERMANQILSPIGLTLSQFKVIMLLLLEHNDGARLADIEDAFCLTHPSAIGIVDNLEKAGFVTRLQNPSDRRSRLVCLTVKARAMKHILYDAGDRIERAICAPLSEAEQAQLTSALKKIIGSEQ